MDSCIVRLLSGADDAADDGAPVGQAGVLSEINEDASGKGGCQYKGIKTGLKWQSSQGRGPTREDGGLASRIES